jgi:glutaminase
MQKTLSTESRAIGDSPIHEYLLELHREIAKIREGTVATYIPELARANPDWFGICVVTTGGNVYEAGDSQTSFTIFSIIAFIQRARLLSRPARRPARFTLSIAASQRLK